ncbi:MAG TPA: hypothetical protein VFO16_01330 [Pseudonocardiaceae bacterium]|nr:hypothetical protein [Pseudonocardiaceae bacterium]
MSRVIYHEHIFPARRINGELKHRSAARPLTQRGLLSRTDQGSIVADHTAADRQTQAQLCPAAPTVVGRTRLRVRGVPPRLSSTELIAAGVSAEWLTWRALWRAASGRIAKSNDHYYDYGFPMPSYLTQILDELTDAGLLTLADETSGLRRLSLTETGQARYTQLTAVHQVTGSDRPVSPASLGAYCRATQES